MARIQILVLLLGALVSFAAASSPQTFCKCTCFKNSTIIPLSENAANTRRSTLLVPSSSDASTLLSDSDTLLSDPGLSAPSSHDKRDGNLAKRVPAACAACTKTFCRSHELPFCHDATDDDVTTSCFRRDSPTDRLIVWGFILGVLGLLGWAAFQKVRAAREARAAGGGPDGGWFSRGNGGYSPLGRAR